VIATAASQVRPSPAWLGRVINAMGEPIDGKGPLTQGPSPMAYRNAPPPAHSRQRVGAPLDLGDRGLDRQAEHEHGARDEQCSDELDGRIHEWDPRAAAPAASPQDRVREQRYVVERADLLPT